MMPSLILIILTSKYSLSSKNPTSFFVTFFPFNFSLKSNKLTWMPSFNIRRNGNSISKYPLGPSSKNILCFIMLKYFVCVLKSSESFFNHDGGRLHNWSGEHQPVSCRMLIARQVNRLITQVVNHNGLVLNLPCKAHISVQHFMNGDR